MGLGDHIRQQLAAKALMRQLERVSEEAQTPGAPLPTGGTRAAQDASRAALCSFETMPGYQQVEILRQMGEKLQVQSPFFACMKVLRGRPPRSAARSI
jgi:hypothetical protein